MGLFDLFSNDTAEKAAAEANAGRQAGYNQLSDLYSQGRTDLTTQYGNASSLYAPLVASYSKGADAYGDASGANGAEGLARAMSTFQNSGQYGTYGFNLTQGLDALDRAHAAAGNSSSGNADTDAMKYRQRASWQYIQRLSQQLATISRRRWQRGFGRRGRRYRPRYSAQCVGHGAR